MNDHIMVKMAQISKHLLKVDTCAQANIDLELNELEMIKMEIEQHIQNMPNTEEYSSLRNSAQQAIDSLEEILFLFEDLSELKDEDERLEILSEITELIDDIRY